MKPITVPTPIPNKWAQFGLEDLRNIAVSRNIMTRQHVLEWPEAKLREYIAYCLEPKRVSE